jgi:hypothetical protein
MFKRSALIITILFLLTNCKEGPTPDSSAVVDFGDAHQVSTADKIKAAQAAQELSDGFGLNGSGIPDAYQMVEAIHRNLTPQEFACIDLYTEKRQVAGVLNVNTDDLAYNLASGAHKVMASYYQSCEALKVGNGIPTADRNHTPQSVISSLKKKGKYPAGSSCQDATRPSRHYKLGSRFSRDSKGNVDPVKSSVDCSGFVSAALTASGLKWDKGQKNPYQIKGTANIHDTGRSSSCFDSPKLSDEESLLPGDILNSSNDHVVIIDSVGKDPMGLNTAQTKNDCYTLTHHDLDFTIVHSSKYKGQNGVHRMHISKYYATNRLVKGVVAHAKKLCLEKFKKQADNVISSRPMKMKPGKRGSRYFSIMRHKGKDEPGCTFDRPQAVAGEACIENCYMDQAAKNGKGS